MDAANGNDALLEKLATMSVKPGENIEGIRSTTGKLCCRATSQDKQVKQRTLERLWKKEKGALPLLLGLLETVRDPVTSLHLASILHECVSAKAGKNRSTALTQLIQLNASHIIIKILNFLQTRDGAAVNESLIHELIWILSQLAQRDGKFSLKTRLLGAVRTFHYFLKSFYNNSKLIYPLLMIIKALSRNTNTAFALAKDGLILTMEKVLQAIGLSPSAKLRVAMNVMTHLSKNKVCCSRIVESNCVQHTLRILERWDRYEGKFRLKLSHYAVVTLQRICYLKSGRKALKALSGLALLYKFCQTCPDEKGFDPLFTRVCGIINFCLERRALPGDPASPLKFPLPAVSDSYLDRISSSENGCAEFDELDSEDDQVDDPDEDGVSQVQGIDPEVAKIMPPVALRRSFEDLRMYARYLEPVLPARKNSWERKRKTPLRLSRVDSFIIPTKERSPKGLSLLEGLPCDSRNVMLTIASRVRAVLPIVKVAYPELIGCGGVGCLQPLHMKDRHVIRQRLRGNVERAMNKMGSLYEIVYDLDVLALSWQPDSMEIRGLKNDDERCLQEKLPYHHLQFESRFESGNLRKAVQVGLREYELVLCPDVNSSHHHFWFYFQVTNMDTSAPYVFNIVNCEKVNSQFNFGMKPVLFSVQEAVLGRPGWVRAGRDICYYRNSYQKGGGQQKCFFTATFTIDFPHDHDVVYIAYHFPYTYSYLLRRIWQWQKAASSNLLFSQHSLCETLNKNQIPVITISAPDSEDSPISGRQTIFLTGRVHPGESNASWIMEGVIEFLVGSSAAANTLRWRYIFIIVPMLNVEGVINGCSRCGLSNEDLNRRWKNPHPALHPEIYHTKGLLEYCCRVLHYTPAVYCDFHGHSRKKNIFLYGCSGSESWTDADRASAGSPSDYLLPAHLMTQLCPAFSYEFCKWRVERGREATARVAVWRDFGVKRSYTLEASYCGCDQGPYSGFHLDTSHLQQTGQQFCEMLSCLMDETAWCLRLLPEPLLQTIKMVNRKEIAALDQSSESSSDTLSDDDL